MKNDITNTLRANNLIKSIDDLNEFTSAAKLLHENLRYLNWEAYGSIPDNIQIIPKTKLQKGYISKYDVIASIRVIEN